MHSQSDLQCLLGGCILTLTGTLGVCAICIIMILYDTLPLHSADLAAWYNSILFAAEMQLQLIMPAGSQRISFLAQKVEKSAVKGFFTTVKGSEKMTSSAFGTLGALSVKAAEISRSISFRTLALMVAITEKFSLQL